MSGGRKWLGRRLELSVTYGELLAIIALVILINVIWPGVPTWVFFVLGFAVSFTQRAVCDVRRWLHRRRAA